MRRQAPITDAETATGLVLCAGASQRMGQPKGLLDLGGVPLLRAHVETLRRAGLRVRVVLGFAAEAHTAVLPADVEIVVNAAWATTGMAESAAFGLRGLGVTILTPVDAPPAAPDTLAALLAASGDAVPCHDGRDGHPVRLQPPHPPGRIDLRLAAAPRLPVADPDCVRNLNTPDEWAAWRRRI